MKKFGVEIEFTSFDVNDRTFIEKMTAAGLEANDIGYSHRRTSFWKLTYDGTCGKELVSPPMDNFDQLEKACTVLRDVHARINSNCGLHVHINARDLSVTTVKNIVKMYARYEKALDQIMPVSRRENNNRFCRSLFSYSGSLRSLFTRVNDARTISGIQYAIQGDRYYKLNLAAFTRHGTVEFRQHSGTVEFTKIKNWIMLLQAMVAKAEEAYLAILPQEASFEEMLAELAPQGLEGTETVEVTTPRNRSEAAGVKHAWAGSNLNVGVRDEKRIAARRYFESICANTHYHPLSKEIEGMVCAMLIQEFGQTQRQAYKIHYYLKVAWKKANGITEAPRVRNRRTRRVVIGSSAEWNEVVEYLNARRAHFGFAPATA